MRFTSVPAVAGLVVNQLGKFCVFRTVSFHSTYFPAYQDRGSSGEAWRKNSDRDYTTSRFLTDRDNRHNAGYDRDRTNRSGHRDNSRDGGYDRDRSNRRGPRRDQSKRKPPDSQSQSLVKTNEKSFTNRTTHTSLSYVQVLGVGMHVGGDRLASVLLHFDHTRLLFNVGEGTQRIFSEAKLPLFRVQDVFLTRISNKSAGGLLGTVLGLNEMTKSKETLTLKVHGPPGLSKLEAAMRRHQCKDRNIDVEYREIESDAASGHATPVFEDPLVTISPVMIQPGGAVEEATPPEPRGDRPPKSGRAVASRAGSGDVGTGVCYLVELSEVPGKFDTVKAEELGLPPRSPQRDQLCRGQTVVNSEGVEVKPRDVMGPPTPGPVVLVVDCPTPRHLAALLAAPQLAAYAGPADGEGRRDIRGDERGREERTLTCVVHLSPAEVVALPEYTAWMASCRGSPQHLLVNAASCNYSPAPSAFSDNLQKRLHCVHKEFFPLPAAAPTMPASYAAALTRLEHSGVNQAPGHHLLKYHLRPIRKQGLDAESTPTVTSFEAVRSKLKQEQPEVFEGIPEIKAQAQQAQFGRDAAELVFLGTGTALASKHRNASGIYLRVPGRGGMILDAGEDTLSQLYRRYGVKEAEAALKNLRAVWISHMHSDHHAGLPAILSARRALLQGQSAAVPPLLVIGPGALEKYLEAWSQIDDSAHIFMDCEDTLGGNQTAPDRLQQALDSAVKELGLTRFTGVDGRLCSDAFSLVLEHSQGWKMGYSADTRMTHRFMEAAREANVLILEATANASSEETAQCERQYGATREAIKLGLKADTQHIILTYLGLREGPVPDVVERHERRTFAAFDLMTVNLADLPSLPLALQGIKKLFHPVD
ncbi:tRNAse Z trz4, mitochondrial [Cymbomonas tetramitiformis]|uniref:ribonuclease Z n=1 Tax=Cymbomonas tetramitiformis TaxID=36881 RepID=A0AAE0L3U2_9CHLO|nr:tRNAse Z trz4, mitochondrial [Cymbomonas tetramitiformis]